MADWRLAASLAQFRTQVNASWPRRDKSSDGTIGDAAHASRNSDHNPWVRDGGKGVVTALDITHDPANRLDAGALAEALRAGRDPRVKYVISNRRIFSGAAGPSPWQWRPYKGANPHTKHMHLSVAADKALYDDTSEWDLRVYAQPVRLISDEDAEPEGDHPWPSEHDAAGRPLPWYRRWWKSLAGAGLGTVTVGGITLNAETIYALCALVATVAIFGGLAWLVYRKLGDRGC